MARTLKLYYLCEVRSEHTMSERGLPLQLAAGVLGEVELGEVVLVASQLAWEPYIYRWVCWPETHR